MSTQVLRCETCAKDKLHVLRDGAWWCCRCGEKCLTHGVAADPFELPPAPTPTRAQLEGSWKLGGRKPQSLKGK